MTQYVDPVTGLALEELTDLNPFLNMTKRIMSRTLRVIHSRLDYLNDLKCIIS